MRFTKPDSGLTRRAALVSGLVGAAAGCASSAAPAPEPLTGAFRHGVASGDPLQDRVIIWTRVTLPAPRAAEVGWELASDPEFASVVKVGRATAAPERDWTVKVDVAGLRPGSVYYYRFRAGEEVSPAGRTQTLPNGPTSSFTIAATSCANYAAGYFNVYRAMAERGDIDLVLQLGDYIYEHGEGGYSTGWGMKHGRGPQPPHEIVTLADYRTRYAQYRSDPDLQAAHAAAPWVMSWDDHESANNAHVEGADNHNTGEGEWSARKVAAVRAYMEWTPTREPEPGRARAAIWRAFEIGDLATLIVLETRLTARSREILWSECPVPADADPDDPEARAGVDAFLRDVVGDPARRLMGPEQEAFVAERLDASVEAGKPWQILGNQIPMGRVNAPNYMKVLPGWLKWIARRRYPEYWDVLVRTRFNIPPSLDTWDGFPAARERLLASARDAGANLITLTGDAHSFYDTLLETSDGAVAGLEFVTSSVTSPSEFNAIPAPGVNFSRLTEKTNPNVLHHNAYERGYLLAQLAHDAVTIDHIEVSTVKSRDYQANAYRRVRVTDGEDGGYGVAVGELDALGESELYI